MSENVSFESFCRMYDSESVCADALFQARWPNGFCCPACDHRRFYLISTRRLPLYECTRCRRQTSVIAGTALEGSSTPLTRWFQALFLLSQPEGISSNRLSQVLGVTYKTAWLISHKLRHAMQLADRSAKLTGQVRVEPFAYGSVFFPDAKQPLLIGAALSENGNVSQVKIHQPDPLLVDQERRIIDRAGVDAFVKLHTDGLSVTVCPPIHISLPPLRVLKHNLCAWLNDTFHGIGAKHLQAYADEFVFRVNLRGSPSAAFRELLGWCASTPVLIYKALTRHKPMLAVPWRAFGSRSVWRGRHLSRWRA